MSKWLSTNETHRKPWNHDLAAALNFRKILFGLREKGERLKLFCRPNQAATTKKKKGRITLTVRVTTPNALKHLPKLSLWPFNLGNILYKSQAA
jgi:hypothetical protein